MFEEKLPEEENNAICRISKNIKLSEGVTLNCQRVNPKLSTCKLSCKESNHILEGISSIKCKGKKSTPRKGSAKCAPKLSPTPSQPIDVSLSTACGLVTSKIKFVKEAKANCDGAKICRPTCPNGFTPTFPLIKCVNPKKKAFKPKKGIVSCTPGESFFIVLVMKQCITVT